MRNKILIALSMLAGIAFAASSFTTHYNLEKSADGDTNWGSAYRSNMDTIDTQIYSASQTADNHIADTTGAHAATAISATSGSLVCLTEDNVQDYLDCLDGQLGAITGGTVVTTNTVQTITASKTFSALQTFTNGITLTGGDLTLPFTAGLLHSDGAGLISSSLLVNADVDAAAGITYSKLSLTDGIVNADVNSAAAIALSKLAATTASRALVSDGSGFISPATTTATEIGYVNGVTSAIQTQLNDKSPIASPTFTGTVTAPTINVSGLTASRVVLTDGSKNLASSSVTSTELGYVSGVTSALQTQLDAKAPIASPTFTGNASFPALVRLVETGGGSDAVSFTGPASTTGYTITLPGSAPTANTALAYDGVNYVWSSAGGWTTYANENISASGSVTTSTTVGQQVRRVTGNAAAVTLSTTPFGAVGGWSDGLVVRLIGQSLTNTVTLVHNDAAKGAILNGDVTLAQYDVIELQYDSTADRWIEIARSIK